MFTDFPHWEWDVPEHFNIGVACSDKHLGTAQQDHIAMIVEDDARGTSQITFAELARKTEGFSGADLKALIDIAIEGKLQEAIRTGIPGPISHKDLLQALKQARPTTREWFNTARNYVLYANQGGLYDEVKAWLKLP